MMNRVSKPSWPTGRKQACFACRQRKKRCDGETPTCGLCARSGNACVYTAPAGQNGFHQGSLHSTPQPGSYQSVSNQSNFVTDTSRGSPLPLEPPSPSSATGRFRSHYDRGSGQPTFEESFQTARADRAIHDASRETPQTSYNTHPNHLFWGNSNFLAPFPEIDFDIDDIAINMTSPSTQYAAPGPPYFGMDRTPLSLSGRIPSLSADQYVVLLNAFIARCHSLLPCLHYKRIQDRVSMSFQDFQSSPLFWAIAASGAWHLQDNSDLAHSKAWSQRACSLIDEHIEAGTNPLETLQALVYVIYLNYVSSNMVEMWIQLGKACRLMGFLGWDQIDEKIQLSSYTARNTSIEEREEQRKAVWALFMLDRAMSCTVGSPVRIDDRHFVVKYPLPEQSFQQSDFSSTSEPYSIDLVKLIRPNHPGKDYKSDIMGLVFRAYALLGRIITYNNVLQEPFSRSQTAEFGELESTLAKFHSLANSRDFDSSDTTPQDRHKEVWLNVLIQTCTILLYRAAIEGIAFDGSPELGDSPHGLDRCINATRKMIDKVKEEAAHSIDSLLNPFLLPAYFLSCRLLTITWHERQNAFDRKSMDLILMLVDRIADIWGPLAERYAKAIMADWTRLPNDIRRLERHR